MLKKKDLLTLAGILRPAWPALTVGVQAGLLAFLRTQNPLFKRQAFLDLMEIAPPILNEIVAANQYTQDGDVALSQFSVGEIMYRNG